jgi:predicted RNA-binding Zn ribbon-like protein
VSCRGRGPVGRYAVVLADALAQVLTEGGADRLRTCVADPCRCVYVDRTGRDANATAASCATTGWHLPAYRRRQG